MPRIVLLLIVLLASCASAPPPATGTVIADGYRRPAPGSLIVLLPPQSDVSEFAAGLAPMAQTLGQQLQAAGYQVVLLAAPNYETVWAQEVRAVGGIYDPLNGALRPEALSRALAALGRRVAGETQAALVLRPSLVLRQATLGGTKADWDGRLQTIPTRGLGGDSAYHSGTAPALSAQLIALAPDGTLAFSTFGGITLPYRPNLVTERNELRSDLFDPPSELAEGITIALAPLAPRRATK